MALAINITNGRGLSNEVHRELRTTKEGQDNTICHSFYGKSHF